MKHNFMTKMVSALLAVVLSTAAFSVTAFASGGEESTESVAEQETTGDVSDLLSALAGSQVTVSVTEDGIQFSSGENDSEQTGTVTTGGGNLNVRTGAGMDYTAFTQLPNGTTVKVIGTDGDWLKVILPEKVGYVYSGYMTVSDGEAGSGEGPFSLDTETLENLLGMLGGGLNGGAALTPDGNLSLIDDIGSPTTSGKQFITVETKNGNVFYGCLFECLPLMGLISAIFTSLFIGSEYSDGTIRNKIIVGHSRIRIYLANLIVCAIASVLISLSYTVGVFVIGNMNGGELITETATIFLCMISSLMISVTFASIMTLLAILNTNKAGNVVVSMILALVLLVSGSFIHQKLGEPKLYDNYVTVNEMGIPTQVEQLPNPQYIEGTPRIVLEVLSDLLPSGQAIQLADAFDTEGMTDESIANAPYRWMGYSLLVTFLTSVLGIALFRKKEIR